MKHLSFKRLLAAGGAAFMASSFSTPVQACGGFFCSRSAPVFQAAERIIFAQDGKDVTQIVEVMYESPSEKFAWILPVMSEENGAAHQDTDAGAPRAKKGGCAVSPLPAGSLSWMAGLAALACVGGAASQAHIER